MYCGFLKKISGITRIQITTYPDLIHSLSSESHFAALANKRGKKPHKTIDEKSLERFIV